jgi:DNA repair ATPase RecN
LFWLSRFSRFVLETGENLDFLKCKRGFIINKERLEWIMPGLNRYNLTKGENQFVKSAEEDFNRKNKLTEQQEEKLESLYKEKSRFLPNRNYFSPKESSNPVKAKVRRFRPKFIPS